MGKTNLFRFLKRRPTGQPSRPREAENTPSSSSPYGVCVWHDTPGAVVDICFIHGLTGDRDRTWTPHGDDNRPWPQEILPLELGNARILTYGYDAYFMTEGVSSGNRLVDHARNLIAELTTNRASALAETRPLIFVVHSLGGLVCKKAVLLSQDNREPDLQGVFKCTKGIIFLGTPHQGSWMASWARIPISALGIVKSVNGHLLKILRPEEELLESIQDDFLRLLRRMTESQCPIEITCFFEELPMPVIGKIVSRESASIGSEYNSISIHANHRDMVRFSSQEDRGFLQILGLLRKWRDEVSLGQSMKNVLMELRHLLEVFEDCRAYIYELPQVQQHILMFNKTLLRFGSCKLRIEETFLGLLEKISAPQTQSLMRRDFGWDDLRLQARIRAYFKDDWPKFHKIVSDLEQNLLYFKSKVSITSKLQVLGEEDDWNEATAMHQFIEKWAAIQDGPAAHMYERLVRKICKNVDLIANFVPTPDCEVDEGSANPQDSAIPAELTATWLDVREHTWNLYEKLSHIWLYNCALPTSHQAQIRLSLPSIAEGPTFNYSFLVHNSRCEGDWRDVTVSSRAKRSHSPAKIDRKGKKKARFYDLEVTELCERAESGCVPRTEIFNICQIIKQDFESGQYIGCLSCERFEYHIYGESVRDRKLIPLKQFLPHFRNGEPIPTRQRRSISLALATSLLLLYDTPWLPDEYWTLDDIYMDPEDPPRLYRRQVFHREGPTTIHNPEAGRMDVVDNQNMFCLAVALLELTLGAPLSNFQRRQEKGSPAAQSCLETDEKLAQLVTAKRLMRNIRKHEDERFASVLIKCMNPPSSSPTEYDFSFGNEAFRRQYIRDVLLPLYQDVKALQG